MKIDEMKKEKPRPWRMGDRLQSGILKARAEAISLQALVFLAQDQDRIEYFLSLTGVQPDDLRGLAGESGFQLAVLDHLASSEALLMQFALEEGIDPSDIGAARLALGGGDCE